MTISIFSLAMPMLTTISRTRRETLYDSSGTSVEILFQHQAPFAVDSAQDLYALFCAQQQSLRDRRL
jgi:hypothetical protein